MPSEPQSLVGDLTHALQAGGAPSAEPSRAERLAELESEHRALCIKRRKLHESIDLLAGLDVLKPDAAARLERYQATERKVSSQRADLYRNIRELQSEPLLRTEQN
jgi:hypothetical protein